MEVSSIEVEDLAAPGDLLHDYLVVYFVNSAG
jgi:hypothetical protein